MDSTQFENLFSKLTNFKKNRFHPLVWINGEPEIGDNVYIGGMSEINANGAKVVIGDNCDISSFVAINCADSHKKTLGLCDEVKREDIIIEENVFIGSHCVVKGGAHIGHHTVVASGTIVEGVRIPPYSLVIGNPMRIKEGYYLKNLYKDISHNRPTLDIEEEQAAVKVIRSGWLAQGAEVERFEDEFCCYLGIPKGHAIAVSSGTAALFLALWALNANDRKVAFPAYVCSSLRHATRMIGAKEILIDSDSHTPNIDLGLLKHSHADIAIIPHMYGLPIDLSDVMNSGIDIIEDCAQALGAKINGIPVGLQGKVGIYSFYATKLITSGGQGGMIASKDKELIDAIRDYREFDQRRDRLSRFNFQMTDLQASVGREQLKKLPAFLKRRKKIFCQYKHADLDLLDVESQQFGELLPVRYRAILKTNFPVKVIEHLKIRRITSIIPIQEWELLGDSYLFPQALKWTKEMVSLPIYPSLKDEEIGRVISAVKEVL